MNTKIEYRIREIPAHKMGLTPATRKEVPATWVVEVLQPNPIFGAEYDEEGWARLAWEASLADAKRAIAAWLTGEVSAAEDAEDWG